MSGAYLDAGSGEEINDPTVEDIRRVLLEFERSEHEPGEVLLMVRGDTISWLVDGRVQRSGPGQSLRSLVSVDREQAVHVFSLFLARDLEALEGFAWQPGDGDRRTAEQRRAEERIFFAKGIERAERAMLEALGPERADVPCGREGCDAGAVEHSVFCRTHHVEQVRRF